MNIPDPAVYASIPVVGAAAVWIGRQFVQSVLRNSRPGGRTVEMNVGEYKQLSELLTQTLNGRYMAATEARDRFSRIDRNIERMHTDHADLRETVAQLARAAQ